MDGNGIQGSSVDPRKQGESFFIVACRCAGIISDSPTDEPTRFIFVHARYNHQNRRRSMKNLLPTLAVAIALLAGCSKPAGQEFSSSAGRFSVRMPGAPKE